MHRFLCCVIMIAVGLAGAAWRLDAQVYPGGYPGYSGYPGYVVPYSPYGAAAAGYGNYLKGGADLTRANGEVIIDNEQARILREKANQAKLDTKKQAFDQMLYEKSRTASYLEVLTMDKKAQLDRMMSFPTRPEIVEGKTLNVMLPFLQSLSAYGTQGPPVTIPTPAIHALNVASCPGSSVGMLRDGGRLSWPLVLRGPQQKKLDTLLPAAVKATLTGDLDYKTIKQIRTELAAMHDFLRKGVANDSIEITDYMRGMDFYNALDKSVKALESPDAQKQLDGTFAARGRNVQELVDFMSESGLKFAPANLGSENAYQTVHDACVRYARAAQSGAGYQASNTPIGMGKKR